jgi:electron transfer flavoprotein alpha subunit
VNCLVIAEHLDGELRGTTLEAISAARELGSVAVVVLGREPGAIADATDVEGVSEIVLVEVESDELDSDTYRRAVASVIEARRPELTLLASTPNSLAYGAAVAVELGLGFAGDVHGLRLEHNSIVATRSFYGGKVYAELDFPDRDGVLLLLRPAVWRAASGRGGATRSSFSVSQKPSRAERLELSVRVDESGVDITRAQVILAIGRGIGERENLELFESLAHKIGGTLAVSRPLVDAGWVTPDRQVGQSGKTVKPKLYIAFGISGASQHLAGMSASETIVAVNTDPSATIFTVADYAAVFDAAALARELEKLY